jgi:hypothetical protein
MTDETPEQVIEPIVEETQETTETTTPTLEELTKQVAELSKLEETRKNEISGLNRANTEAEKKYQELLKKTETETETKEREARERAELEQKRLDELTTRESKTIQMENALNVKLKAVELGLGDKLESITKLGINTVEGVELYKAHIEEITESVKSNTVSDIEKNRTGNREILTGNKSGVSYPNAIEKAFD